MEANIAIHLTSCSALRQCTASLQHGFISSSRVTLPCNYRGKPKGLLFPAYQVDFHLLSHKQASKSIYRFPSCSQGVNKQILTHTHAPLAPASASDYLPCSVTDSPPVSLSSFWNKTSYLWCSSPRIRRTRHHIHSL